MTVIARDAVAADHLVYAWPFPLGPECEVPCADDEQVVMCPARLLTRRVVLAGTPYAVTDPSMLGQIVEELVAYNPTAGAVFGVELIRMGYLAVGADDGSSPYMPVPIPPSTPPVYPSHFGELGS